MLFNQEECMLLQFMVEEYDEKERRELPLDIQRTLSSACLSKLSNLNSLTYFTKQEFSLLLLATRFAQEFRRSVYRYNQSLVDELKDRLMVLATPIGM